MNFIQAFKKADENDYLFSPAAGNFEDFKYKKSCFTSGKLDRINPIRVMRDDWEIIPAEPKVLTVRDWINKNIIPDACHGENRGWLDKGWYEGFIKGHQNGRLERDLELRPLVEAAESQCMNMTEYFSRLNHEFKNIPPLNEEK